MQVFNRNVSGRGLTVFGFEIVLISGSIAVAGELRGSSIAAEPTLLGVVLVTALCQLCFYYNDLYDLTIVHSSRELVVRLLQAAGAATIVLAFLRFTMPWLALDASTFIMAIAVFVVAVLSWRLAFNYLARDPHLEEHVLIVGSGHTAQWLAQQIGGQQDFAYRLVGFIDEGEGDNMVPPHDVLGTTADIERIVHDRRVERIVVGLSDRRGHLPVEPLLKAKLSGVRVEDAATTYERLTGKILIDDLKPSWLIFSDGFRASRFTRFMKRLLDLSLSIIGLILAAPLMALTAVAVWLDSPGPPLYSQDRVGENGPVFRLYKFRSMRTDAESAGQPVWAQDRDERITRVGRVIRKTRLDELPQLWNVMRGDMSFVGPRPERPFFVEQLAREIPLYSQRHAVKPGITGWAQVKYRYGSSIDDAKEKLRYDLYYIKHLSIVFDLTIVVDTVKVVLLGRGSK